MEFIKISCTIFQNRLNTILLHPNQILQYALHCATRNKIISNVNQSERIYLLGSVSYQGNSIKYRLNVIKMSWCKFILHFYLLFLESIHQFKDNLTVLKTMEVCDQLNWFKIFMYISLVCCLTSSIQHINVVQVLIFR